MPAFNTYPNPSLAVDLVIFGYHNTSLNVLLLNRREEPFKNSWTLPGAFLKTEETFLQTCERVLKTKLGLTRIYLEQLYSFDDPKRDPRGRAISVSYYALINPEKFKLLAGKMANDVQWFKTTELPKLGFDHDVIFQKALERLKSKILYQPVGFELLDEEFTMTELHDLFETILDVKLDRRNFRRKIIDALYILPTGKKREGLQNRHPDLFRFNNRLKANSFHLNIDL